MEAQCLAVRAYVFALGCRHLGTSPVSVLALVPFLVAVAIFGS